MLILLLSTMPFLIALAVLSVLQGYVIQLAIDPHIQATT